MTRAVLQELPSPVSASPDSLTVYTVPSKISAPGTELDEPYRQVVGIESAQGVLWTSPDAARGIQQYIPEEAEQYSLPVTPETRDRILGMWASHYMVDPQDRINCHRWAQTIEGGVGITAPPKHIVERGVLVDRLALGQHGVIGYKTADGVIRADHSVSGLGEESDAALQALSVDGPVGIVGLDQIKRHYDKGSPHKYGLYVLPAEAPRPADPDPDL